MSVGVWASKHPSGTTTRAIDFAGRLEDGETLSSPTATVTRLDGPTTPALTAPVVTIDGATKIRARLTGGAAGGRYEVFLQAQTSSGLTVEDCAEISVENC